MAVPKFVVGDRVVFNPNYRGPVPLVGTVVDIRPSGLYRIKVVWDDYSGFSWETGQDIEHEDEFENAVRAVRAGRVCAEDQPVTEFQSE